MSTHIPYRFADVVDNGDRIVEQADYDVTITVELRTMMGFAPIERDGPLTVFDAITNCFAVIPSEQWAAIESGFGGEFEVKVSTAVAKR